MPDGRGRPEALEVVRSFTPEMILMDLMMPGLDGLETTRRLKADPATQAIPVLALTADATPSGVLAAKNAGCDDFMTKPVVLDDLVDRLCGPRPALTGRDVASLADGRPESPIIGVERWPRSLPRPALSRDAARRCASPTRAASRERGDPRLDRLGRPQRRGRARPRRRAPAPRLRPVGPRGRRSAPGRPGPAVPAPIRHR